MQQSRTVDTFFHFRELFNKLALFQFYAVIFIVSVLSLCITCEVFLQL